MVWVFGMGNKKRNTENKNNRKQRKQITNGIKKETEGNKTNMEHQEEQGTTNKQTNEVKGKMKMKRSFHAFCHVKWMGIMFCAKKNIHFYIAISLCNMECNNLSDRTNEHEFLVSF